MGTEPQGMSDRQTVRGEVSVRFVQERNDTVIFNGPVTEAIEALREPAVVTGAALVVKTTVEQVGETLREVIRQKGRNDGDKS